MTPDPLRKAAIVLASLDPDAADALIEQMPPEQSRAVREAMMAVDDVEPAEQDAVISEFLRLGMGPEVIEAAGVEVEADLAARLGLDVPKYEKPSMSAAAGDMASQALDVPFSFLQRADAKELTAHLRHERPQTVALVLSHLPCERGAEVLSQLPPAIQAEVIARLADLGPADPDLLREVERGLETRLSRPGGAPAGQGGAAAVISILQAASTSARREILDNLAWHEPELAARLAPPVAAQREPVVPEWTFADLTRLGDFALAKVFAAAELQVVTLALAGAPTEFVQRVLGQLPPREARLLRRRLDDLGPTRLRDVEEAQRELAVLARQLSEAGRQETARTLSLSI